MRVTGLIRDARSRNQSKLGFKVFNAVLDDPFQLEMLRTINERCEAADVPDFLVYGNRLFDPDRIFDGGQRNSLRRT